MTPAQWAQFESSLSAPYSWAELLCDGTRVRAEVRQTKPLRFEVMVFVNGVWRGGWLRPDMPCDEQRFMNLRSRAFYSAKDLAAAKKVFSAKQLREMAAKKYSWFSPTFPTAKALRRRLSATCKQIDLVDCSAMHLERLAAERARQRTSVLEDLGIAPATTTTGGA